MQKMYLNTMFRKFSVLRKWCGLDNGTKKLYITLHTRYNFKRKM